MRTHPGRPRIGRIAITLVAAAMLGSPATAGANVLTDISDFNLSQSTVTYGSYLTTSASGIQYRWVDAPSKANYVGSANCYNNAAYGSSFYPAGTTAYLGIGTLPSGWCFNLRGNTAAGQGTMLFYDGRLSR